jgi:hypothetical protein
MSKKLTAFLLSVLLVVATGCSTIESRASDVGNEVGSAVASVQDEVQDTNISRYVETYDRSVDQLTNTSRFCESDMKIRTATRAVEELRSHDMERLNVSNMSYDEWKQTATYLNAVTNDLARVLSLDIGKLPTDYKSYQKLSKETTRYSMVIPEYNDLAETVQEYKPTNKSANQFYADAVSFAFATAFITAQGGYSTSYKAVQTIWFNSGLTRIALYAPKTVGATLSSLHWAGRKELATTVSTVFEDTVSSVGKHINC